MSEQRYTCEDCGDCMCEIVCSDVGQALPTNCIFGGGTVKWKREFDISEAIDELESRGYVCIKKTREE